VQPPSSIFKEHIYKFTPEVVIFQGGLIIKRLHRPYRRYINQVFVQPADNKLNWQELCNY